MTELLAVEETTGEEEPGDEPEPDPDPGDDPEPDPGDDPEPDPGDDPEPDPGDDPEPEGESTDDFWTSVVVCPDDGDCYLPVQVHSIADDWLLPLVVFASFVLVSLGALVVGLIARR